MVPALGLMAVGGAVSAYSSIQAGAAQKKIMDWNATSYEMAAEDAIQRGGVMASRELMKGGQVRGAALAMAGGSGVDVQSGSVTESLMTTAGTAALDAEMIKANAVREALGLRAHAAGLRAQGEVALASGINAGVGAGLGAVAQIGTTLPKFGK
jgi:hypothetical protein